eukprot:Nitzschia sp. Nitz4//scaffold23_size168460//386//4464//NITZ4_002199-RA/size168460-augustus-gene-0.298-mRNA-1//-1//CDS//3329543575//9241//frame0
MTTTSRERGPCPELPTSLFSLPEWTNSTSSEDEEGHDHQDNSVDRTDQEESASETLPEISSTSALEALSADICAVIFHHLTLQELASVALVSKALYQATRIPDLWRFKCQAQWHIQWPPITDWFAAYQQAYLNTHDLWITHWNCVHPSDALAPGRSCIVHSTAPVAANNTATNAAAYCPNCRYHPTIQPSCFTNTQDTNTPIQTEAQAIARATYLRLQQHKTLRPQEYCPRRATNAFCRSATLHRPIDPRQFSANALHFLSDLLFFQVHQQEQEFKDYIKYMQRHQNTFHSHPNPHHHTNQRHSNHLVQEPPSTAFHSWHSVHFTNPDASRPLVWRISIMRKDCFTVYPSEGYLLPGQSQLVVFGVKPLASLLAHSTRQINAHREGVQQDWANLYAEEAHLPPAPFLIHYHLDSQSTNDTSGATRNPASMSSSSSSSSSTSTPWQQSGKPQQPVRIMFLSAHVQEAQTLDDFRRATLVPFSLQDPRTTLFCAPQLQARDPSVWNQLERLEMERQKSVAGNAYRTEPPCVQCHQAWGPRWEEVGQAFVLAKLEAEWEASQRDQELQQVGRLLRQTIQHLNVHREWTERHHQLMFVLHQRLVDMRGAPWLTQPQESVLIAWESAVDYLLTTMQEQQDPEQDNLNRSTRDYFMVPWRHAGVYRNRLCTDSVFEKEATKLVGLPLTRWKEEPRYLEVFAHLAHSPGRFCLGPQEDPNHLRKTPQSRYSRRQRGCVTDMFFDDPVCGLQAALCVVSDPRSLMVHGIWDRVPYPGTLTRRPRLLKLPPLQLDCIERPDIQIHLHKFIANQDKLLYYELQNSLDVESLLVVDSWFDQPLCEYNHGGVSECFPYSLKQFLRNVPPPGSGRFPLSRIVVDDEGKPRIHELVLFDRDNSLSQEEDEEAESTTPTQTNPQFHDMHIDALNGRPGPSLMNLLFVLSSHLGWTVDDNQGEGSVYVDRRILIGGQWLSISLMAAPLGWTLFARYARWIPSDPVDYPLQALPFTVESEMRFLSEQECGRVLFVMLFSWLCLGRWIERYTSRDFFRAMLEHVDMGSGKSFWFKTVHWCQRQWDSVCPLFLQRMVFVPSWNRRSQDDLMKHVAFWRHNQSQAKHGSTFHAVSGGGFVFFDNRAGEIQLGEVSWSTKVIIGITVTLSSFCACSPHFFLNVLTIFSGGISLGMSMSLQSMETGRAGVTVSTTGSIVATFSIVTIVVLGFLVGQLVGSSGGVLFLAELVVFSISLVLGGGMAISAKAMESWGTFFCFAVTAFWGFLFGRVSIMEGIRQKRSGFSSIMLCLSLLLLATIWFVAIFVWEWESPIDLVIARPLGEMRRPVGHWSVHELQ